MYDEILRMLLVDNMTATAEPNDGAGCTMGLIFSGLT